MEGNGKWKYGVSIRQGDWLAWGGTDDKEELSAMKLTLGNLLIGKKLEEVASTSKEALEQIEPEKSNYCIHEHSKMVKNGTSSKGNWEMYVCNDCKWVRFLNLEANKFGEWCPPRPKGGR